ncbi:MAG: RagB/SusD family nutrient uptake outer membrane protein [Saprospiraceae bacterium]|nr:RagB/SusD family nutrient uptake outer membrane protein [Saprospiraceae bacterium]
MMHIRLIIILIFISTWSCSLDEDPRSQITPDEFFLEDRDARAAVDAIYYYINDGNSVYARYYWLVNALLSDLGTSDNLNPAFSALADFSLSADNPVVESIWSGLYAGIAKANYAIQNLDSAPISENERIALLAEARFLRAFFYFDLVRFFGSVPIVTKVELDYNQEALPEQSPVDSVNQFIEDDLNYAFDHLPTTANPGRPTNYAAAAMLCKYFLTNKNYSRAAQASRYILQGSFSLQNDYASLFKNNSQNNTEFIWSVNLNSANGADVNLLTLPRGLGGRSRLLPIPEFYADFNALDRRKTVTFLTSFVDNNGNTVEVNPHVRKYYDPSAETIIGHSPVDFPLIRFADILLLHAEALNALRNGTSAEALGAINLVRARARFDGTTALDILPDLGKMNKEDFAEAILLERKRELGWEGHRWFDLVRFNKLNEKVLIAKPEISVSDKHNLLPIPNSEITLNPKLNQNPGYE